MRKRGHTLIELVAVIAILSILASCGFTFVKGVRNIKTQVELDNSVYTVYNFLSYAKAYCRKNFLEGRIIIDEKENSISFKDENKIIKVEKIPSYIRLSRPASEGNIINVSDMGYLDSAGSLNLDYENRRKTITISVGIDNINIK